MFGFSLLYLFLLFALLIVDAHRRRWLEWRMRGGARSVRRRQRAQNWALVAVLVALWPLFYVITIVRMSGG